MFDLELTEEQRLLEQSVREWAGREVAAREFASWIASIDSIRPS